MRFLISCLLMAAMTASATRVEIIGHRGASFDAPENTLASVKLAWEQGADAAEVDVALSKDGQVVVIHDSDTKKLGGRDRAVADQTLAELQELDVGRWQGERFAGETIPTLAEVIATIPDGKRMLIEVKTGAEIVPALIEVLKNSGKQPEQLAVIGFSLGAMAAVKRGAPEYPVYQVARQQRKNGEWSPSTADLIRQAKSARLDGLDLSATEAITPEAVAAIHAAGLKLCIWTVNDPEIARLLIAAGVDGITTDRPGWLRERIAGGE